MSLGGEVIHRVRDRYGELRVCDDGVTRTLSFGPGNEQSAILIAEPARPLFEYIQVMLLALLFQRPRKVLCLGLGAGSLITTLHAQFADTTFTAVELREAVLDAACRYFCLPDSERLALICRDAADFLADPAEAKGNYDLIFSDLYSERGLDPIQLEPGFLAATAAQLAPDGLLVINCWFEHQRDPELLYRLQSHFRSLRLCATGDGNWIIFAARRALESRPDVLRASAARWSDRLGCSLTRHLRQLKTA